MRVLRKEIMSSKMRMRKKRKGPEVLQIISIR